MMQCKLPRPLYAYVCLYMNSYSMCKYLRVITLYYSIYSYICTYITILSGLYANEERWDVFESILYQQKTDDNNRYMQ